MSNMRVGWVAVGLAAAIMMAGGVWVVNAQTPRVPSTKAEFEVQQKAQRDATIRGHPAPTKPPDVGPLPRSVALSGTRQAGIFTTRQGIFSPTEFDIRNEWYGPYSGDRWMQVYAGGKRTSVSGSDTSTLPALRIYVETPRTDGSLDTRLVGVFVAPGATAADRELTIISVNGTLVSVRTDAGKALTFDLSTSQFA
jgi:hypothetical protein